MQKRLVLFVEGAGDVAAAPVLVKKILNEKGAWDCTILDENPFEIKGLHNLTGRKESNWTNKLRAGALRKDFGGALLLLDGDEPPRNSIPFCAKREARALAHAAKSTGAGATFSLSVVFACLEYESWLLASANSLRGKRFPDGRRGIPADADLPTGDFEVAPRNAKKWFNQVLPLGYSAPLDQKPLTQLLDLDEIRAKKMRSFLRLENALDELIRSFRTGKHVATPST